MHARACTHTHRVHYRHARIHATVCNLLFLVQTSGFSPKNRAGNFNTVTNSRRDVATPQCRVKSCFSTFENPCRTGNAACRETKPGFTESAITISTFESARKSGADARHGTKPSQRVPLHFPRLRTHEELEPLRPSEAKPPLECSCPRSRTHAGGVRGTSRTRLGTEPFRA